MSSARHRLSAKSSPSQAAESIEGASNCRRPRLGRRSSVSGGWAIDERQAVKLGADVIRHLFNNELRSCEAAMYDRGASVASIAQNRRLEAPSAPYGSVSSAHAAPGPIK